MDRKLNHLRFQSFPHQNQLPFNNLIIPHSKTYICRKKSPQLQVSVNPKILRHYSVDERVMKTDVLVNTKVAKVTLWVSLSRLNIGPWW